MNAACTSVRLLQRRAVILQLLAEHPCPVPVSVLSLPDRWELRGDLPPRDRTIFTDVRVLADLGYIAFTLHRNARHYALTEQGSELARQLNSGDTSIGLLEQLGGLEPPVEGSGDGH